MADSSPQPSDAELQGLLAVLRGLRVIAEGRLSGLAIATGEYLADIYCIQRVAHLLAMELSALGRTLRRPETQAAETEVHRIEALLAEGFAASGWDIETSVMNLVRAEITASSPG